MVNTTEVKQKLYQESLERVEALQTTNTHHGWIAENMERAEMVDFLSTELLHWVQQFATHDRAFKQLVRRTLQSRGAVIFEDKLKAIKAAHGEVISEKDERRALHTQFESNVEGKQAQVKEVIAKVHENALAVLKKVQMDDALQNAQKEEIRTLIMQKAHEMESSIHDVAGHNAVSRKDLWSTLKSLNTGLNMALSTGLDALSLERVFDGVAAKIKTLTHVMHNSSFSAVELGSAPPRVLDAVQAEKELADRDAHLHRLLASAVGS